MRFGFDVTTAAAISRAYAQAPEIVLDELETAMGSAVSYLFRETVERTPSDQGLLKKAFYTSVDVMASIDAVFGTVGNSLPYAVPVELGTKPHFPPIEPLIDWASRHSDFVDKYFGGDAVRAAHAVQKKIGRFGTPAYGMARYALMDGKESIQAEFEQAAERIVARVGGLA